MDRKTMLAVASNRGKEQAPCQLRIERKLYAKIVERAKAEGMTISGWIRFATVMELRRKRRMVA